MSSGKQFKENPIPDGATMYVDTFSSLDGDIRQWWKVDEDGYACVYHKGVWHQRHKLERMRFPGTNGLQMIDKGDEK